MKERCPLCGAASRFAFATLDRNRHVSDVEFHYRRCSGCGVLFLEDVPEDLAAYYSAGYHRAPAVSELDTWSAYESYKLDVVRNFVPSGRIVDIGSSYGAFPYLAARGGYDVTAIEIDAQACTFMREVIGVRAIQSATPEVALRDDIPEADAITLWHSIEHLHQPWRTIEAAAARLREGGLLVVATPDPDGLQGRWLKGRFAHVDAPRHLFLIPQSSLVSVAAGHGLRPIYSTSADVETRRCNRMGWQRGLQEMGWRVPGAYWAGAAIEVAARPLELRPGRGSAYLAVLERQGR